MISAVWLVRSHQIAADLRYWLTFIGYDKRDHSLSHKVYLAYATLFFTVWAFATLTLLATWAGAALRALGPGLGLGAPAAGLVSIALLAWFFYRAFRAGQSSPLTFSEDDAALICQAPVSRPAVALLWLLGDWIKIALAFWALAVTLAFAQQDQALGAAVSVEHVPRYALAGLQALAVVLPLQWGLMALAYAWGMLRLQRDRERRAWWAVPLVLAVLAVGLLAGSGLWAAGGLFSRLTELSVLFPLTFPVASAYGLAERGAGLLVALVWAGLGSLALGLAARPLNLGRAAQESTGRSAAAAAAQAGNPQAAAEISLRRKLGTGHPPARLPAPRGWLALAWQVALAWSRRGILSLAGILFIIFAAGLGVVLAPDWGARAWSTLAWLVAVQQFVSGPLVDDLRLWPTLRGLPVSGRQTLLGSLLLPMGLVVLLGGFSLLVGVPLEGLLTGGLFPAAGGLSAGLPGWAVLLAPGAAFSCGLAAALDVLRSSRSSRLLIGQAPMPGTTGVLIAGVIAGLAALTVQFMGGGPLGFLTGGLVLAGAGYLLLDLAAGRFAEIE